MSADESSQKWFTVELDVPYAAALTLVTEALRTEGFGVLTRADLHDAFREKLGVSFRPYTILGACNPPLALQALQEAAEIGLFLPCNVTVEEMDEGRTMVRLSDPKIVLASADLGALEGMESVADDARARIERVAHSLQEVSEASGTE